MLKLMLKKLWHDECGALLSFEWVLLATLLVLAMVVGLKTFNQALLNEYEDMSNAVGSISQSYSFKGARGSCSSVKGSHFKDRVNHYNINTCTRDFDGGNSHCER
jgi:Flp pilus assembly pilin Flp